MQITDPSSSERISISHGKAMPRTGQSGGPVAVEMTAEQRAMLEEFRQNAEPDPAERAKGLAQQQQVKAHTVFTVKGKIVGVQDMNGWSLVSDKLPHNFDLAAKDGTREGQDLAEHRAKMMEKALRSIHGDLLEVHSFSGKPDAPTMGQLEPALSQGKTLNEVLSSRSGGNGNGSTRQLLALTGSSLSLLHGSSR